MLPGQSVKDKLRCIVLLDHIMMVFLCFSMVIRVTVEIFPLFISSHLSIENTMNTIVNGT
jgi:hypothetical protein